MRHLALWALLVTTFLGCGMSLPRPRPRAPLRGNGLKRLDCRVGGKIMMKALIRYSHFISEHILLLLMSQSFAQAGNHYQGDREKS